MNVYGSINDNRIVNYIVNNIKKNNKTLTINDVNAYVDLVHIQDVVDAFMSILLTKNFRIYKDFTYDISSKKQVTIKSLILIIEKISDYKFNRIKIKKTFNEYLFKPYRKKRLIKWNTKISLKEGLKKTYYLFFP